jgi:hypothetical protein
MDKECCENCKHSKIMNAKWLKCIKHNEILKHSDLCTGWEDTNDINVATKNERDDKNMNKAYKHEAICKKLNKIYEQKNADYNDCFAKARKEVPNYTLGKLYDKFERFKQLSKHENQVKDETICDTLTDLANYAIMELLERQIESEENNNENK